MNAFTLRLEPPLAKKFEKFCREKGYSKTGLVKSLIRDFLARQEPAQATAPFKYKNPGPAGLAKLVGIMSLGGDSVEDKRHVFE